MNSDLVQSTPAKVEYGARPGDGRVLNAGVSAKGKFLFAGESKFYVRGVTYGPFRPEADGCEYHTPAIVGRDFAEMRQRGINAVRTYTLPPRWLLDQAEAQGLRVLVGLPWEQHITFLAERRRARDIGHRIQAGARACAGHPALLGLAVGNEIPAPLVRWYGHRRVEQFLERLYQEAKGEAPEALVTYVNYPSTEYLELPFLDFAAFNVYLESPDKLRAYLARLQNITGDRPLVMGEIGLDSLRRGEATQAETLGWQSAVAFEAGCAGLFFFSWTDEWHRGGHDIEDWQFGLVTAARRPKAALAAVQAAFEQVPFATTRSCPLISVVVCTYNGRRTLGDCLRGVTRQEYPNFEVIVVDDGSTDGAGELAREFGAQVIRVPNGGLSNARNIGWQAARGEIVAYLDDDASPDPNWLAYLAAGFRAGDYAGVGGPNIAWPGDGWVAKCVDHAPGNPTHVLLTDQLAEHLPGCNMAFRRSCLAEVGGFDTQFRIAGDDVDLCWRLQERGWRLAFHPGAMVWHHRRGTLRGYWKQQVNYGKAEAMLERKWPEKYNAVGHATWSGRMYAKGFGSWLNLSQRRIYHGTWGSALFQSVYSTAPGRLASVLMLPEWYLVIVLLALLSVSGVAYAPLRFASLPLAVAFLPPLLHAALNGARAVFRGESRSRLGWLKLAAGTASLHFLQPAARLWGRLCQGLTPWRRRGTGKLTIPWPQALDLWSEGGWQSADQRLKDFENTLHAAGAAVARGGDYDRWDLEVRGGLLGTARLLMVIEEHGEGRQYIRMRLWPMASPWLFFLACLFAGLAAVAAADLNWAAWALLNIPAILLVGRTLYECASASAVLRQAIALQSRGWPPAASERDGAVSPGPKPVESAASWQAPVKASPPSAG